MLRVGRSILKIMGDSWITPTGKIIKVGTQTKMFEQNDKKYRRLRGKFATIEQIDNDKKAKKISLVMRQNTFLKNQNEMYLRMVKALNVQLRILKEQLNNK
jgi:hypothetical protein